MPAAVISVKRRRRATRAFSFFAVGECCRADCLNCDSFDLDDFWDCFFVIVSSLAEPGSGIVPGPGDEGVEEVFAVGEGVVGAAPLQVFMDRHEGGEPEAGGGYPADERMGLREGVGGRRGPQTIGGNAPRPTGGAGGRPIRGRIFVGGRGRGLSGSSGYPYGVSPHEVYLGVYLAAGGAEDLHNESFLIPIHCAESVFKSCQFPFIVQSLEAGNSALSCC